MTCCYRSGRKARGLCPFGTGARIPESTQIHVGAEEEILGFDPLVQIGIGEEFEGPSREVKALWATKPEPSVRRLRWLQQSRRTALRRGWQTRLAGSDNRIWPLELRVLHAHCSATPFELRTSGSPFHLG